MTDTTTDPRMADNNERDIHPCPHCTGHALNKGIIRSSRSIVTKEAVLNDLGEIISPEETENVIDHMRQIFCIEHGVSVIPLEECMKKISQYEHEFLHYAGSHLEEIYKQYLPHKYKQFLMDTGSTASADFLEIPRSMKQDIQIVQEQLSEEE